MTNQQKETIYNDTEWIKIIFRSSYSSGEILLKKNLYEIKRKKIEKEFKAIEYHIIRNYHLNLNEVINMDDEINLITKEMNRYSYLKDYYTKHNDPDLAKEYNQYYLEKLDRYYYRIEEIRKEFNK